jgi:hypothetical protein
MTAENIFPKVPGDVVYSSELNKLVYPVLNVFTGSYTGSSFDCGVVNGTASGVYTFPFINGPFIGSYIVINATVEGNADGDASTNTSSSSELYFYKASSGASPTYSQIFSYLVNAQNYEQGQQRVTKTIRYYYALSGAEKTEGLFLRAMGYCSSNNANAGCSIVNKQVVLEAV